MWYYPMSVKKIPPVLPPKPPPKLPKPTHPPTKTT